MFDPAANHFTTTNRISRFGMLSLAAVPILGVLIAFLTHH